jgi:hypothetical protein
MEADVGLGALARASATLLPLAVLAGCGQPSSGDGVMKDAQASTGSGSQPAYLAPPRALAAELHEGVVRVQGRAPERATVELTSPEGDAVRVQADGHGSWRARLPAGGPRLYAISAMLGGRTVHAEGALVTAPGALAPAVTVRAGDASWPLLRSPAITIATVDYDPSGVAAVAGGAPAHASVSLRVDGAAAAVGQADAEGRYALLSANHRLSLGPHRLEVRAPDGVASRDVLLQAPEPLTSPYRATPAPGGGWRVAWALTGGGEQTTLILPP